MIHLAIFSIIFSGDTFQQNYLLIQRNNIIKINIYLEQCLERVGKNNGTFN